MFLGQKSVYKMGTVGHLGLESEFECVQSEKSCIVQ